MPGRAYPPVVKDQDVHAYVAAAISDDWESTMFDIPREYHRMANGQRIPVIPIGTKTTEDGNEQEIYISGVRGGSTMRKKDMELTIVYWRKDGEGAFTRTTAEGVDHNIQGNDLNVEPLWSGKEGEWGSAKETGQLCEYAQKQHLARLWEHNIDDSERVVLQKKRRKRRERDAAAERATDPARAPGNTGQDSANVDEEGGSDTTEVVDDLKESEDDSDYEMRGKELKALWNDFNTRSKELDLDDARIKAQLAKSHLLVTGLPMPPMDVIKAAVADGKRGWIEETAAYCAWESQLSDLGGGHGMQIIRQKADGTLEVEASSGSHKGDLVETSYGLARFPEHCRMTPGIRAVFRERMDAWGLWEDLVALSEWENII